MRTLALAVGCAIVLAAPAAADAKTWRGKTNQGRAVSVRTGADDLVDQVRVSWRAPCKKGHYVSRTLFQPPLDVSETEVFEHSGTYRKRLPAATGRATPCSCAARSAPTTAGRGRSGSGRASAADGHVVDSCRLKRVRWSAEAA